MRRFTFLLALCPLLLTAGCADRDALTAIEEFGRFIEETVRVEAVQCETTTPAVAEPVACWAYSDGGRVLRVDGQSVVRWSVNDPEAAEVDLNGVVVARDTVTFDVTATDPNGGQASLTPTPIEP